MSVPLVELSGLCYSFIPNVSVEHYVLNVACSLPCSLAQNLPSAFPAIYSESE